MGAEGLAWGEEEVGRTKEKEGGLNGKAGMGWVCAQTGLPSRPGDSGWKAVLLRECGVVGREQACREKGEDRISETNGQSSV